METVLEILKYTIPGIVVLIASVLIVKRFLVSQVQLKQMSLMHDTQDTTIRLRLQAYERMALYVERLQPRNLLTRVYEPSMNVAVFQQALMFNIRTEFEHNLSQQIYVSKDVWNTVRGIKEQQMNMINNIAKDLPPDAPAKELHRRLVDYLLTVEGELPTDTALNIINDEAKVVLSYGAITKS
jgi:hypothetical protein